MTKTETRKDLVALQDLFSELKTRFTECERYVSGEEYLKGLSAIEWLDHNISEYFSMIEASGSISRNYISRAIEQMIEVEHVVNESNKRYDSPRHEMFHRQTK